jgi:tripartite-type tricarboxylate transporter receptor subunit TctC
MGISYRSLPSHRRALWRLFRRRGSRRPSSGDGGPCCELILSGEDRPRIHRVCQKQCRQGQRGSGGVGSGSHVFWALFTALSGTNTVHIPYRGEGPAISDRLGGQVQAVFPTMASVIEYVRTSRLRLLAVTGPARSPMLSEVPTVGEFVPGYDASGWWGIGAPRNTPTVVVERLNKEINASLDDLLLKQRIAELGDSAFVSSPGEFRNFIADYTDKWGKVIRAANIKID